MDKDPIADTADQLPEDQLDAVTGGAATNGAGGGASEFIIDDAPFAGPVRRRPRHNTYDLENGARGF